MADNNSDEINWPHVLDQMQDAEQRSRGYASYWEWPLDRSLEEAGVARTLASYLAFAEGTAWREIDPVQDDPPDVLLTTDEGRRIGVEVTELVDSDAVKSHRHRKKTGEGSPYDWAIWTAEMAAHAIRDIVQKKDQKLLGKAECYDSLVLAIATDEPMISLALAQQAVSQCLLKTRVIDRVFLVISYDPGADKGSYPDGCPVLSIAVQRG